MSLSAALAAAFAAAVAPAASAELVAKGLQEGSLALGKNGTPFVAFVRGTSLVVSNRLRPGSWRQQKAATVTPRARVMAFEVGSKGPVVLVQSADARSISLVRRRGNGWQKIRIVSGLGTVQELGWPGLALGPDGATAVAYTRWSSRTLNTRLLLARVNAAGRVSTRSITAEGFPRSLVPPPAAPVFVGSKIHVVESYGFATVVGTLEWYPDGRTWTGFGLDAGRGDFPVGPVFAKRTSGGTLYAAWTESVLGFGAIPVTLATRKRNASSEFILDRAFTTALALTPSGPEVAANEWVEAADLGLPGDGQVWAGTIVGGRTRVELDGRILGLASAGSGARDLLLARDGELQWFRSPARPSVHVSIEGAEQAGGKVRVTGHVEGASGGRVTVYRERPGGERRRVGQAAVVNGSFSIVDSAPGNEAIYRAVYVAPATGIPYAALMRQPVVAER